MIDAPVVTIFVRHGPNCAHASNETYKNCRCRKHLRWSYGGKQFRQSAKTRSWAGAEESKRQVEAQFQSGGVRLDAAPPAADTAKTLRAVIHTFIASKKSQGVGPDVVGKYQRELRRLCDFCEKRSKVFPGELKLDDLIDFRSGWDQLYSSSLTRQKVQERLRGFLRYLYEAGHTERPYRLSPIRADEPPTMPLSETQYKKVLATIPTEFKERKRAAKIHGLVQLMRYSGLSIRDAVTIRRDAVQYDRKKQAHRIVTSRQKTGTHVSVIIPNDIASELLAVANGNPQYIFWNTGTGTKKSAASHFQDDIRKLFRAAGFPTGHSHQFRDTFAVDLLSKGMLIQDVSRLLGHESIKTTEKYYAKWVPERQDRLDDELLRARAR